jgi:hypothetical protein
MLTSGLSLRKIKPRATALAPATRLLGEVDENEEEMDHISRMLQPEEARLL